MRPSNRSTELVAAAGEGDDGDGDGDGERGSAALEFILVGLLMLVPLVYLIVSLGLIQGQSLGAEAAARHIARAVSTATDATDARGRADAVLAAVAEEYGLDDVDLAIGCTPAGASCPRAGATLHVTVRTAVTLPLVPPVLGLENIAAVPIEATGAHKVSRFWSGE
ncbi:MULTISPECIES: pilus assembly protein [unclassified Microbacterium]|uniref:TadE/TadG family type IV pilus assembly protein n=1 Tax=unclassified Microbacterium TaxID=2609290 RepID=UPI0013D6E8C1|nr:MULTISPECIES: pilus assembly protein [unclassified Microbacterium]